MSLRDIFFRRKFKLKKFRNFFFLLFLIKVLVLRLELLFGSCFHWQRQSLLALGGTKLLCQKLYSSEKFFIELLNFFEVLFLFFILTFSLFECEDFNVFISNLLRQGLYLHFQRNILGKLLLD